ncbi:hypothetical protein D9758_018495 [Tetrapyrgos nigripes]|uniref:RNase H type-1 domain-containing protein n=1 Tax=Tetrapyrgos nigripes TaxID=182062 RepID=A0A8H5BXK5_9AGAR|nr:hypothetical protein D9758_018495 [Tetrapyrgos nigripes]
MVISKCVVGDQSNDCAHLYAILLALQLTPANCALHIHSSSEYLINSLTYWAPRHAKTGWACTNSDLLSAIALWIASRPAPVKLFKVKSHSVSLHLDKVTQLAKSPCDLPLPHLGGVDDLSCTPPPPHFCPPPNSLTQPKLSTNLEPRSPPSRQPTGTASHNASFGQLNAHGRSLRHLLQMAMRDRIVEASVSPAAFWKLYKKLYQECFRSGKVPTAWLITLLSALPKHGRDLSCPDNYCAIALESYFLKFGTLIVLHKLTKAAEDGNLIPASQNGFHTGHRTHNNTFILRSLIECARSRDISNVFPLTNHNALWNRLEDLGLTGMYYNWLCNLYRDMCYRLVQGDNVSEDFEAGSGVLMGDPASPLLWNLYLSSFQLASHADNMTIDGTTISHLEHADDMLEEWCFNNFLSLSPSKSEVMIFGDLCNTLAHLRQTDLIAYICGLSTSSTSPFIFTVNSCLLKLTDKFKYVGTTFCSTERDIFTHLYDEKANAATISSHGILSTEHLVGWGRIPPHSAKTLYTALIDCHLIFGCEIALDVTNTGIQKLEKVQNGFLRLILGLSRSSPLPPLFTETGIHPLPAR